MPLKIIRQDITKIKCDAIVNPTDPYFSHGGGVDAAVHEAAGRELYFECLTQTPIWVGQATVTSAYALPCKYVIHTVGPEWEDGSHGEEAALRSCYLSCLDLAANKKCKSIAFPLISSGTFGFPKDRVLRIAIDVISDFLFENEMLVYIVVFDKTAFSISEKLFSDVAAFIDDTYARFNTSLYDSLREEKNFEIYSTAIGRYSVEACDAPICTKSLEDMLSEMDKGFADTLFEYIDQKGITSYVLWFL